jgi:hypothetical protein
MIDDQRATQDLLHLMEANLPIPARPISGLAKTMRGRGVTLPSEVLIKRVLYRGDEGGILCDITISATGQEAILCSLTHLRVRASHPLAEAIRAYQQTRIQKLARLGTGQPTHYTIEPRRNRRH